ncbi:MAG: hypothetical protein ACM3X7_05370 [Solirubrobacterales bacterium]
MRFISKRSHNFDLVIFMEAVLYLISIICIIYFSSKGVKLKVLEPVMIIALVSFIKITMKKLQVNKVIIGLIYIFIFISMIFANEFDFYSKVPKLDKIEHLLSGVILFYIGDSIFNYIVMKQDTTFENKIAVIMFSFFFAGAAAGFWEIFEFSSDTLLGFNSQNGSLFDTMTDIIYGTLGAMLSGFYSYFKLKNKIKQTSIS